MLTRYNITEPTYEYLLIGCFFVYSKSIATIYLEL